MGILSRFGDIMSANINSILEKAEAKNADKLLEKYLRDAKESLEQVKSETAAVIADEMAAGRRVTALEDEIARLSGYAEQAVAAGNDADALRFLEAKQKVMANRVDSDQAYALAKKNSDQMRQMTKKLISDINEADAKLNELKGKLAIAKQTERMNELSAKMGGAAGAGVADYDRLADVVQKRIDAAEAKAGLSKELDENHDINTLKEKYSEKNAARTASANDELAALKAKLGRQDGVN
jgi:phage shock protein A